MIKNDDGISYVRYNVGEKYDKTMSADGAVIEANNNVLVCTVGLSNISVVEKRAIKRGSIKFSVCDIDDITFVGLQIGRCLQFDMPFNMRLYNEFRLRKVKDGESYAVLIILVENKTNIIQNIRMISLGEKNSKRFYELSQKQWEHNLPDYNRRLKRVRETYSIEQIIKKGESNE